MTLARLVILNEVKDLWQTDPLPRRQEEALSPAPAFDTMRMQGHPFVEVARALWSRETVTPNVTKRRKK